MPFGISSSSMLTTSINPFGIRLLILFLLAGSAQAMWTQAGQAELVESSDVIVSATFVGQASISLPNQPSSIELNLGVLNVTEVFKGNQSKVLLLRVPSSKGMLRRSDDIHYRPGQTGLWYLRSDKVHKGVFLADHPNRFVDSLNAEKTTRKLRELLRK